MKKYKFNIRKVAKKELEIEAKNNKEAFGKIIKMLEGDGKILFKKEENNEVYEIKLEKVRDLEKEKKDEEINRIIADIFKKSNINMEKIKEKNEKYKKEKLKEKEKEILIEMDEIICEKCGNHIQLDEIL